MFDRELKKRDLNPLIKVGGAYLVDDSDPDASLFINVCRDIGLNLRAWGGGREGFLGGLGAFACPLGSFLDPHTTDWAPKMFSVVTPLHAPHLIAPRKV